MLVLCLSPKTKALCISVNNNLILTFHCSDCYKMILVPFLKLLSAVCINKMLPPFPILFQQTIFSLKLVVKYSVSSRER